MYVTFVMRGVEVTAIDFGVGVLTDDFATVEMVAGVFTVPLIDATGVVDLAVGVEMVDDGV